MKKFATFIAAGAMMFSMQAADVEVVVEAVDNGGIVPGNTYRVYAIMPSADYSLHAVFADTQDQISIETTGAFYQHPYGNYSTLDINPGIVATVPELAYDSWVTIGAEDNQNNNLWSVGAEFDGFAQGQGFSIVDGAWFLIPTDVRTIADAGNKVLLLQLTTDGEATGVLNFQGWKEDGQTWQERGVTFSTNDAKVFGCTDLDATNYNIAANYNDGTCQFADDNGNTIHASALTGVQNDAEVQIFPNPVWEGQFNLQFSQELNLKADNLIVEIFDGSGKIVLSQELSDGSVIGGNRVVIDHDLSAGNYTVSVQVGGFKDALQVVVTK